MEGKRRVFHVVENRVAVMIFCRNLSTLGMVAFQFLSLSSKVPALFKGT